MRMPPSVCVYCGSRDGVRPEFAEAAEETGRMIARNGWRLVYGAGNIGLMGRVARSAQEEAEKSESVANTFGVIPESLYELEVGNRAVGKHDLTSLVMTETMHERKMVMIKNANAVVVLPGGPGSLDEFFEALTWRQLKFHDLPILLLNVDGYWTPLVELVRHVVDEGFAKESLIGFVETVNDVVSLEKALRNVPALRGGNSAG